MIAPCAFRTRSVAQGDWVIYLSYPLRARGIGVRGFTGGLSLGLGGARRQTSLRHVYLLLGNVHLHRRREQTPHLGQRADGR